VDRQEVLDVGPSGLRRPSGRAVVVVVLALVAAAVVVYLDHRSRVDEGRALDACRAELHDAAVASDLQMMAVATTTHPPTAPASGQSDAGIAGILSRSARQLLPAAVGADDLCRGVTVRPWHFSLKARRDATTAYADALAAKLRDVARNGRTSYIGDPSLRSLRRAADLVEFGGHS
jgi:hypothetical protein